MMGKMPLIPRVAYPVCDVRDVALAHIRAMLTNEAVNNRHIVNSQLDFISVKDISVILDNEFKNQGYKLPGCQAPNILVKTLSIFDKPLQQVISKQSFFLFFKVIYGFIR
jgi:dihydroflavonol-4-reductase